MGRGAGRKVLYEALRRGQETVARRQAERLRNQALQNQRSMGIEPDDAAQEDIQSSNWPPKRPAVAAGTKRIEISLTYPVAIGAALAVVIICLSMFKIGQITGKNSSDRAEKGQVTGQNDTGLVGVDAGYGDTTETAIYAEDAENSRKIADEVLLGPVGDHIIIIALCQESRDLEPVKEHYALYGVDTEIEKRGNDYFLVAVKKYQSPKKEGSDGFLALQRIKAIGASYVAPPGYRGFGVKPFQDAYGDKIR